MDAKIGDIVYVEGKITEVRQTEKGILYRVGCTHGDFYDSVIVNRVFKDVPEKDSLEECHGA